VKIAQWNTLRLDRFTSVGAYLVNELGDDVLLPNKYIEDDFRVDDEITVFVYKDQQHRLVATTQTPKIELNQFAYLKINYVNEFGAFADWGLEKDLFIPYREQPKKLEEGKSYMLYLYLDSATERLVATSRIGMYISEHKNQLQERDKVVVSIWEFTDLGVKVIVNHMFQGIIYTNDLVKRYRLGEQLTAYVKHIRPDGKLDLSFLQDGYQKINPLSQTLLDILSDNDGFIDITDKSSPEEIAQLTGWSKKTFKQVVGNLYKERKIQLGENGITIA
jgi:uncharacterized protein